MKSRKKLRVVVPDNAPLGFIMIDIVYARPCFQDAGLRREILGGIFAFRFFSTYAGKRRNLTLVINKKKTESSLRCDWDSGRERVVNMDPANREKQSACS